jgi:hypothetical protein
MLCKEIHTGEYCPKLQRFVKEVLPKRMKASLGNYYATTLRGGNFTIKFFVDDKDCVLDWTVTYKGNTYESYIDYEWVSKEMVIDDYFMTLLEAIFEGYCLASVGVGERGHWMVVNDEEVEGY